MLYSFHETTFLLAKTSIRKTLTKMRLTIPDPLQDPRRFLARSARRTRTEPQRRSITDRPHARQGLSVQRIRLQHFLKSYFRLFRFRPRRTTRLPVSFGFLQRRRSRTNHGRRAFLCLFRLHDQNFRNVVFHHRRNLFSSARRLTPSTF